jgi:sugar-specific transcriptional regulator TrmB
VGRGGLLGEEIARVLDELGLSTKEVKVYLHLSKSGPRKVSEISKNLGIHKVEVYRFLRNLESKGLAESTFERPRRIEAIPFEHVLDSLITERRKAAAVLVEQKATIMRQWKKMFAEKSEIASEKYMVLSGRESVYLKMLHMIKRTRNELLAATTNVGFLLADTNGFLSQGTTEILERSRSSQMGVRFLTQVTKENLEIVRSFSQKLQLHNPPMEIRHLDLGAKFVPRLVICDSEEVVIFLTPSNMSTAARYETGLWTTSKTAISALQALFEELWKDSKLLSERIKELEKRE